MSFASEIPQNFSHIRMANFCFDRYARTNECNYLSLSHTQALRSFNRKDDNHTIVYVYCVRCLYSACIVCIITTHQQQQMAVGGSKVNLVERKFIHHYNIWIRTRPHFLELFERASVSTRLFDM